MIHQVLSLEQRAELIDTGADYTASLSLGLDKKDINNELSTYIDNFDSVFSSCPSSANEGDGLDQDEKLMRLTGKNLLIRSLESFARVALATKIQTVGVEQVFSIFGMIKNKQRNELHDL